MTRRYRKPDDVFAYLVHRRVIAADGPEHRAARRLRLEWLGATLVRPATIESVEAKLHCEATVRAALGALGGLQPLIVGLLDGPRTPGERISALAAMHLGADTGRNRTAIRLVIRLGLSALARHYGIAEKKSSICAPVKSQPADRIETTQLSEKSHADSQPGPRKLAHRRHPDFQQCQTIRRRN